MGALQNSIWTPLERPVGRPSLEMPVVAAAFSYQAQSRKKPRHIVAKIDWHPGELHPRVAFIVTNLARRPSASSPSPIGAVKTRVRSKSTRLQADGSGGEGFASVAGARLQPGQLHADAGDAKGGGVIVNDEPAGEPDQDWREGRPPSSVRGGGIGCDKQRRQGAPWRGHSKRVLLRHEAGTH